MKNPLKLLILVSFMILSTPGFADSRERLRAMQDLFASANIPNLDKNDLDQPWICAEVSGRSVKNPFEVTFRKTGAVYTLILSGDKSIVAVPSVKENCWIGKFDKDFNFLRMLSSGDIISEFGSLEDSETGLRSSIDPNINLKGYVTCSKL